MAKKIATKSNQQYIIWTAVGVAVIVLFFAIQAYLYDSRREAENPGVMQTIEGLKNKEPQPDGTTKITFDSPNPDRPNVLIGEEATDKILFERSVISQDGKPITLSEYLNAYGEPERVISGTQSYGAETNLYIFAGRGIAFIANQTTDRVLELHTFPVMTTESYLQKFSNEN